MIMSMMRDDSISLYKIQVGGQACRMVQVYIHLIYNGTTTLPSYTSTYTG